ncbi:restriction endonuclease subunit S [Klebsiella pneumoniae]
MVNTCQQRFNRHRTRAVGAVNGDNVRARLRQHDLQYIAVFASYLIRLKYIKFTNANYTKIFLGSQLYWLQLYNGVTGTGQPNVNGNTLKKMFFPLPPSSEQNKICSRVQTLLNLCEQLEQHANSELVSQSCWFNAMK